MVKKRPTQPSVLFSPQGPFGNPDHYFFSLSLHSLTSRTSQPARQAFIFGKRIPYISPRLIPILKAPVSHSSSSSQDRERERERESYAVCIFLLLSSLPLPIIIIPPPFPNNLFLFSFHSSRLVSSRRERQPARPRRTGASDLVGLPLVSVRGIDYSYLAEYISK